MQLQGFRARVAIGPATGASNPPVYWFAVKTWSVSDEAEGLDTTNSEGYRGGTSAGASAAGSGAQNSQAEPAALVGVGPAGFQSRTPGPAVCRIELGTATMMFSRNNPFLTPFAFTSQKYYEVRIYPNRGSLGRAHRFPFALLTSCRHEGDVSQLQPVTLSLESDGDYGINTSNVGVAPLTVGVQA